VTLAVEAVAKMKRASTSSSPLEAATAATSWSPTAEVAAAAMLFPIHTATLMRQSEAAARASAPTMLADAMLTQMAASDETSDVQVPLQRAFDLDLSDVKSIVERTDNVGSEDRKQHVTVPATDVE